MNGFAIFPNEQAGAQAQVSLLKASVYQKLSIFNAIERYAPAKDKNDPRKYADFIKKETGTDVDNVKFEELTDDQFEDVYGAMRRYEGAIEGAVFSNYG